MKCNLWQRLLPVKRADVIIRVLSITAGSLPYNIKHVESTVVI